MTISLWSAIGASMRVLLGRQSPQEALSTATSELQKACHTVSKQREKPDSPSSTDISLEEFLANAWTKQFRINPIRENVYFVQRQSPLGTAWNTVDKAVGCSPLREPVVFHTMDEAKDYIDECLEHELRAHNYGLRMKARKRSFRKNHPIVEYP